MQRQSMPRAVALTLVLALFVAGHANSASATTFLLSNTATAQTGAENVLRFDGLAIRFTTTSDAFTLTGIGVTLSTTNTAPGGNVFLEVLETTGSNLPATGAGSSIISFTIPSSELVAGGDSTTPTFYGRSLNRTLQPNTDYWLAVTNDLDQTLEWHTNGQTSAVGFPTFTATAPFGSSWTGPVSTTTSALMGTVTAVPEPSTIALVGSFDGIAGIVALSRKRLR